MTEEKKKTPQIVFSNEPRFKFSCLFKNRVKKNETKQIGVIEKQALVDEVYLNEYETLKRFVWFGKNEKDSNFNVGFCEQIYGYDWRSYFFIKRDESYALSYLDFCEKRDGDVIRMGDSGRKNIPLIAEAERILLLLLLNKSISTYQRSAMCNMKVLQKPNKAACLVYQFIPFFVDRTGMTNITTNSMLLYTALQLRVFLVRFINAVSEALDSISHVTINATRKNLECIECNCIFVLRLYLSFRDFFGMNMHCGGDSELVSSISTARNHFRENQVSKEETTTRKVWLPHTATQQNSSEPQSQKKTLENQSQEKWREDFINGMISDLDVMREILHGIIFYSSHKIKSIAENAFITQSELPAGYEASAKINSLGYLIESLRRFQSVDFQIDKNEKGIIGVFTDYLNNFLVFVFPYYQSVETPPKKQEDESKEESPTQESTTGDTTVVKKSTPNVNPFELCVELNENPLETVCISNRQPTPSGNFFSMKDKRQNVIFNFSSVSALVDENIDEFVVYKEIYHKYAYSNSMLKKELKALTFPDPYHDPSTQASSVKIKTPGTNYYVVWVETLKYLCYSKIASLFESHIMMNAAVIIQNEVVRICPVKFFLEEKEKLKAMEETKKNTPNSKLMSRIFSILPESNGEEKNAPKKDFNRFKNCAANNPTLPDLIHSILFPHLSQSEEESTQSLEVQTKLQNLGSKCSLFSSDHFLFEEIKDL